MDIEEIEAYSLRYSDKFRSGVHNNTGKCSAYLSGLFSYGKSNMEDMSEHLPVSQQQLHHFVSVSDWDAKAVMGQVAGEMETTLGKRGGAKGLLLDESGWLKKGKQSVGVARQYLGSVGKTDNGQVVVFGALCQGEHVGLVEAELYLPKAWTGDWQRLRQAGVPRQRWQHQTKPELALGMVERLEGHISYEWIGGDSIYGNSAELRRALDGRGKLFVLDTNAGQELYLQHPAPQVPPSGEGRGRKKSSYVSAAPCTTVLELAQSLPGEAWQRIGYRKGTKGWLERQAAVVEVFLWSAKRPNDAQVEHYRLLLSKQLDGQELKYSLVNDTAHPLPLKTLLYYQMQRYWVERALQESKQQLGMAQYQVRGWKALNHHLALTMMALHYIVEQQLICRKELPLLSAGDVRLLLAQQLARQLSQEHTLKAIAQRHAKRKADIDRYYKE